MNEESILFRESDHVYFVENSKGREKYTSVTTLLNGLHPKKDLQKIAEAYYDKHGCLENVLKDVAKKQKMSIAEVNDLWGELEWSVECILKIWKDLNKIATDRGSKYHAKKEEEAYQNGGKPVIIEGDFKVGYNLKKLNGEYPELIIYHPFYKVCGTADITKFYTETRNGKVHNFVKILDFKTNRKGLDRKSFKGQKLLSPVSHLEDCNYWVYVLQLSIYAFILEEWGYECDGLEIIVVKDVDKDIVENESIPYLKQEAKTILTYFRNNGYKL
jgi:hypothetical protein